MALLPVGKIDNNDFHLGPMPNRFFGPSSRGKAGASKFHFIAPSQPAHAFGIDPYTVRRYEVTAGHAPAGPWAVQRRFVMDNPVVMGIWMFGMAVGAGQHDRASILGRLGLTSLERIHKPNSLATHLTFRIMHIM